MGLLARHLKPPPRTASPQRQMAQQGLNPQARQPPPRPPLPPKQERLEEKLQERRMLLARRIARSPNRRLAWMSLLILGPFFNTTHCNSTTNVESLPMNCFYCRKK